MSTMRGLVAVIASEADGVPFEHRARFVENTDKRQPSPARGPIGAAAAV